ncbi:MAG: outer membrane protein transport protein [Candidatus Aminicenantes bacterium]|nr:outer membrane protein transport protein [Candidatus Aminicenantes bacterium]MDH5706832.1 outer membrane protein transport protein [Candidatus Aminicenantes bacterium]
MKIRIGVMALVLLMVLALSPFARGTGFLIYEHGAVAMAMGGAFIGLANNPTAIWHNPAGIAWLDGTQMSFGTTLIFPSYSLTLPNWPVAAQQNIEAVSRVFYPPNFYLTHKFSDRIVAGFGFFTPYGLGVEWPEDYPLRFISTRDDMKTFFFNPTIAFKLNDNLSVAVGVSYVYSTIAFDLVEPILVAVPPPEVPVTFEANGDGWGLNAGALYKGEKFSFGFNWRGGFKIDYDGDLSLDLDNIVPGMTLPGTAVTEFSLPHVLGVGVAFNLTDKLTLTADVHYILWSSYDEFTVAVDVPGIETIYPPGIADKVVEENWEDSFVYRVGMQYQVSENFALRAGFLYDETPQPVETMDPILPDSDRWALTAGFGYKVGKLVINAAYQYEPFKDRTSPNRDVYLDSPIPGINAGEGTYSATAHLFGLSIGIVF